MTYNELVRFAQWMATHADHRPYVYIESINVDDGSEDQIHYDGMITPDDVERFSREAGDG